MVRDRRIADSRLIADRALVPARLANLVSLALPPVVAWHDIRLIEIARVHQLVQASSQSF